MRFGPERRSPGEAAIERPINSPTPERQAFPQAAWSHAQGVGRRLASTHHPELAKPVEGNASSLTQAEG